MADPLSWLILALAGATLALLAAAWRAGAGGDPRLARRLGAVTAADAAPSLRKAGRRPAGLSPAAWLERLLARAGSGLSVERLAGLMAAVTVAATVAALALGAGPLVAPALGLAAGIGGPVVVLRRMAAGRVVRFAAQLPEALAMMARSLRAGHPINAALGLVAREMPEPLGGEFATVFDEMTYGLDLREALGNLCRRMDGRELRYMAVAISIQQGSGGNLAELLDTLARVLRDIGRMHRKVRALSAEGRLSAAVLSVLPFGVALGITALAPGYYDGVLADPPFLAVLGGGFAGIVLGIAMMARMVNFRI
ncbi:type II secretion system F family protein [Magnetospirillum sp. UT-4]|uniref:type II secretion system F family protein n=1 Tax=Magnetospirillum sp. UT-4 TaxID=2681467 RepID=UPI0013826ABC|nr:type II secretion system F family protein [Magnetospirillum sp. UT-4]CAA7615379.1 Flp pilus assembly protein TadB [Magnetospirillum sp. UT-4]